MNIRLKEVLDFADYSFWVEFGQEDTGTVAYIYEDRGQSSFYQDKPLIKVTLDLVNRFKSAKAYLDYKLPSLGAHFRGELQKGLERAIHYSFMGIQNPESDVYRGKVKKFQINPIQDPSTIDIDVKGLTGKYTHTNDKERY